MVKKYIVELESGTHIFVLGPEGIVHIGEPDVVYETVDGMQIGDAVINAEPYTEPDLEQVRKEAYENGYKTAKIQCGIQAEKDMREVGERHYQRGLSDAWKAVRKIIHMPEGDLLNIFTECYSAVCTALQVILKYDAPEAIEKLRDYEQDEKIKVGDEVEDGVANLIVTEINNDGTVTGLTSDGSFVSAHVRQKTGRHFPEIATVLKKMRGEQDG